MQEVFESVVQLDGANYFMCDLEDKKVCLSFVQQFLPDKRFQETAQVAFDLFLFRSSLIGSKTRTTCSNQSEETCCFFDQSEANTINRDLASPAFSRAFNQ